jgi:hypothetical protein
MVNAFDANAFTGVATLPFVLLIFSYVTTAPFFSILVSLTFLCSCLCCCVVLFARYMPAMILFTYTLSFLFGANVEGQFRFVFIVVLGKIITVDRCVLRHGSGDVSAAAVDVDVGHDLLPRRLAARYVCKTPVDNRHCGECCCCCLFVRSFVVWLSVLVVSRMSVRICRSRRRCTWYSALSIPSTALWAVITIR